MADLGDTPHLPPVTATGGDASAAPWEFAVGSDSNGNEHTIFLPSLPHLFLSYCDERQLAALLSSLGRMSTPPGSPVRLFLAMTGARMQLLEPLAARCTEVLRYRRDEPEAGDPLDRAGFVKAVAAAAAVPLPRGGGRRMRQPMELRALVVLDDLWALVTGPDRATPRRLLRLLEKGQERGVHFVVASPVSFRNLLSQLGAPADERRAMPTADRMRLGAELFATAEGLLFLRRRESLQMDRLFPTGISGAKGEEGSL